MSAEEAQEHMRAYIRLFERLWNEGTSGSAEKAKVIRDRLNEYWDADYDSLPCYMVCYDTIHAAS